MATLARFLSDALDGPERPHAFAERRGAQQWSYTSSARMGERARAIAYALRARGVAGGDRVALISNNRVDWLAADFGILAAGCVVVPMFATLALDQIDYILADSGATLCFVETAADARRLRDGCPHAPRIVHFDGGGPDALETFEAAGARAARDDPASLARFTGEIAPDDLAVLIYTSGTTGDPKGVMLSHRNLTSNAEAGVALLPADFRGSDAVVLSVLPFAHIYEHTMINIYINCRVQIFVTQPEFLLADLKDVRPRMMTLVPRIFERVLAGIVGQAKAKGGLAAKLVPWALGVGRAYASAVDQKKRPAPALALQYALASRLVLAKIRPAIGLDRLQFFASGSAPLHRDIALTFAAIGVPIAEGYGLTETSPIVTGNPPAAIRYGSVGTPIAGVEIALASDGEILVKGPNVMLGYYKLPDERPFTGDGWFKTGDIGEIDRDGYLYITDRKKELIKTSAGKYVAPGRVEAALKRSVYVGQCFVIGDGRPYPAALVAPNWDLIRREFAISAGTSTEAISERGDVRAFVLQEVRACCSGLAKFESIRTVALLPRDLTVEDGELSPTMKIKRRIVEKRFAALIESAYANSAPAHA